MAKDNLPPGLRDLLDIHQDCFVTATEPLPPADLASTGKQLDELKSRRNAEYRHFLKDVCVPLWQQCQTSDVANDGSEKSAAEVKDKIKKLQEEFKTSYENFRSNFPSSDMKLPLTTQDSNTGSTETKPNRYFPCIFYTSFWFPDTRKFACKMDFTKIKLNDTKVKINDTTVGFQEGMIRYLERYYSNGDGVHRVPPVMFHNDRLEVKGPKPKGQKSTEVKRGKICPVQSVEENSDRSIKGKSNITSTSGGDFGQTQNSCDLQSTCEPPSGGKTTTSVCAIRHGLRNLTLEKETNTDPHQERKEHQHSRHAGGREVIDRKQKKGHMAKHVTKLNLMTDHDIMHLNHEMLKNLSDDQRTEILRKRKSDRAVDQVANSLVKFATREKLNAIILTDFKYSSYLQNVVREKGQFVSNVPGDHDVMVICKEIGIVFIQVKSNLPESTPTIPKDVKHALRQLLSDKYTFWQSNRDLPFIDQLPIYCFIAVPFLTDSCLKDFNICPTHKLLIMSSSVFEANENLSSWLKDKIPKSYGPAFENDQYRILTSRYIGQGSIEALPNPIKTTAEQLGRVLLNPDQQVLLKDPVNKRQVIAGNYGTGKTLLLTLLAKKIRVNYPKAKLHCITCSDISKEGLCNPSSPFQASHQMNDLLRDTTRANVFGQVYKTANSSQKVPPFIFVTSEVFFDTLSKIVKLSPSEEEQHFLVDEVPLALFETRENSSGLLDEFLGSLSPNSYVWISIASHTYKVNVGTDEDPAEKAKVNIHSSFNFCYLKYTMRVSKRLFKMVQEVEAFTQDGHHRYSKCGHVIDGPMPRLYTLEKCTCNPTKCLAGTLPCECSQDRLTDIFENIFELVKANFKSDIVVLIEYGVQGSFYTKLCETVDAVLKNQKKKWLLAFKSEVHDRSGQSSPEDSKQVITVADGRTFRGCENRIVIVVDPYRMNQWFRTHGHVGVPTMVLTRCLGQYIHVTWPEEESWIMCSRVLDEYDELIDKYHFMGKSWQNHMREFVRQARISPRSTLINTLIKKDLIFHC